MVRETTEFEERIQYRKYVYFYMRNTYIFSHVSMHIALRKADIKFLKFILPAFTATMDSKKSFIVHTCSLSIPVYEAATMHEQYRELNQSWWCTRRRYSHNDIFGYSRTKACNVRDDKYNRELRCCDVIAELCGAGGRDRSTLKIVCNFMAVGGKTCERVNGLADMYYEL